MMPHLHKRSLALWMKCWDNTDSEDYGISTFLLDLMQSALKEGMWESTLEPCRILGIPVYAKKGSLPLYLDFQS